MKSLPGVYQTTNSQPSYVVNYSKFPDMKMMPSPEVYVFPDGSQCLVGTLTFHKMMKEFGQ